MTSSPQGWQPYTPPIPKASWLERSAGYRRGRWLLVAAVAVCTIGNFFWLTWHFLTIPPPWDQAFYLYMGVRYLWAFSDHGVGALAREFIGLSPDVAPLFPLTSLPLYLLFGPSRLTAYMTNALYLLLLFFGVYRLAACIYGRRAGILAAFVMGTFTATVNYSRDYLLEFPAMAFVTLAMYAFVRCEEFRHRPWCLRFGILAGLSILTKTMAGVFFIGPVLYSLGYLVRQRQLTSERVLNGVLALATGVLVASIWWGPNFRTAFGYLLYYGFQAGSVPYTKDGLQVLTFENLSYYALALVNHGTSFFYAGLLVALMLVKGVQYVSGARRSDSGGIGGSGREGMLWAWLLVGYAILTVVPNKGEERYAQPLLPPIALLLAGTIETIGWQGIRRTVVAMVLAIGGSNYLGLTYGLPLVPQRLYVHPFAILSYEYPHYSWVRNKIHSTHDIEGKISDILHLLTRWYDQHRARLEAELRLRLLARTQVQANEEEVYMSYRLLLKREPRRRELPKYLVPLRQGTLTREALLEILRASGEFKTQRANVLIVPDHPQCNASTLRYYAEVSRLPLRFAHILDGPITPERLQMYEFILTKRGGYQGPEFSTRMIGEIHALLQQSDSGFVPMPQSFEFPDDSQIVIFAARTVVN
jgi:4-amino-4-deoxy-L-arabinose transferase-like glycosyltransferase